MPYLKTNSEKTDPAVPLNVEFILFDVIGTTVKDSREGESLVLDHFIKAFESNGITISYEEVNRHRGKSKKEAVRELLEKSDADPSLHEKIYTNFMSKLTDSASQLKEMEGATELFAFCKDQNIRIGIGSGLPTLVLLKILSHIGWDTAQFEYIGSSEELDKSRPDPVMILDAMNKLSLCDKSRVLKVGDTVVDIREGKNAGVLTAAVLTGTQGIDQLEKENPDYILESILDLKNLITA